jgi:hypothetical protein
MIQLENWWLDSDEMRFQVLIVESMKMTIFWDVTPCRLVEID